MLETSKNLPNLPPLFDEAQASAVSQAIAAISEALVVDNPAAKIAIQSATTQAIDLAKEVRGLVVTKATAPDLTRLLIAAKGALRDVEDARKALTKPLQDRTKEIQNATRPLEAAFDNLISEASKKHVKYLDDEDRMRREREAMEQRRIAEERKAAEAERIEARVENRQVDILAAIPLAAPPVVGKPVRGIKTEAGTASLVAVWQWEVTDIEKVPRQYLAVDAAKITHAVKSQGARTIPGLRIYETKTTSVRRP
jgi:hypothetical protein